jgi:hypothetical protein
MPEMTSCLLLSVSHTKTVQECFAPTYCNLAGCRGRMYPEIVSSAYLCSLASLLRVTWLLYSVVDARLSPLIGGP